MDNKTLLREIADIADTVALVAYVGGDSKGQMQVEMSRLCDTYNLQQNDVRKIKQQITTVLQRQYNL
mgnify:CR=1 FL=1